MAQTPKMNQAHFNRYLEVHAEIMTAITQGTFTEEQLKLVELAASTDETGAMALVEALDRVFIILSQWGIKPGTPSGVPPLVLACVGDDVPLPDGDPDDSNDNEVLSILVNDAGFSFRSVNCLQSRHILNLGALIRWKAENLLEIGGFGKRSLADVRKVLKKHGLKLKDD